MSWNCFMHNFMLNLIKTAGMTDVPTFSNKMWKLGSGGSNKYEYIWCMELGMSKKLGLGLSKAMVSGIEEKN